MDVVTICAGAGGGGGMRQGRGGGAQPGWRGTSTSFTPGSKLANCSGGCGRE